MNIILDLDGFKTPAVTLERHSITAYEELLKIPCDVTAAHRGPDDELWVGHQRHGVIMWKGQLFLQEFEEWVSVFPIHLTLLKDTEVGLIPIAWADIL